MCVCLGGGGFNNIVPENEKVGTIRKKEIKKSIEKKKDKGETAVSIIPS